MFFKPASILLFLSAKKNSLLFKKYFLNDDTLWLFGSRVDDTKRGGDIDLCIQTHELDRKKQFERKMYFLVDLEKYLGEQKIDLVMTSFDGLDERPIVQHALKTGIQLQ